MTEIKASELIRHDRGLVFRTLRDRLAEIVPYIPNVTGIDELERTVDSHPEGDVYEIVNLWHGEGSIPSVARRFIKADMLRWTETARWDQADWVCSWHQKTAAFTERVRCSGQNTFTEIDPGVTRVDISGEFGISLERFPGLPRMLSKRAEREVEQFIARLLVPNLRRLPSAVDRFLDESVHSQ